MKERPILYNDEMVRAILAGRKTQTRRPMATKRIYATGGTLDETWYSIGRGLCILMRKDHTWPNTVLQYCPFGTVADVLWVRESARVIDIRDSGHWGKCYERAMDWTIARLVAEFLVGCWILWRLIRQQEQEDAGAPSTGCGLLAAWRSVGGHSGDSAPIGPAGHHPAPKTATCSFRRLTWRNPTLQQAGSGLVAGPPR